MEELRSDGVHTSICCVSRENSSNQHLEGVTVVQICVRGIGIGSAQLLRYSLYSLLVVIHLTTLTDTDDAFRRMKYGSALQAGYDRNAIPSLDLLSGALRFQDICFITHQSVLCYRSQY